MTDAIYPPTDSEKSAVVAAYRRAAARKVHEAKAKKRGSTKPVDAKEKP